MRNKVIIIDSGITKSHPKLSRLNVEIEVDFSVSNLRTEANDLVGHGTAVAGIIGTMNREVDLHVLKIYGEELVADEAILLNALEYINENDYTNCLVHMSLGLGFASEQLRTLCSEITQKGNLIVSAFDNSGAISYPAAFDFVVGVESNENCVRAENFKIAVGEVVDVYAKGGLHRVASIDGGYLLRQGNSMSAAYVTGMLSRYLPIRDICMENVAELLSGISLSQATQQEETNTFGEPENVIEIIKDAKAILFPYNKEIINLVNFSELLPFKIEHLCCTKYSGHVGKKVGNLAGEQDFLIENIDAVDFGEVDLLILGHTSSLESLIKQDLKKKLLQKCLDHNVRVYSFDEQGVGEFAPLFQGKKNAIFSPETAVKAKVKKKTRGKMYPIKAPVLGVFGTSSKQGKFTLQLFLRKCFLENGYKISQLSSEPTGILYGMDDMAPFGFNSELKSNSYEFIASINAKLNAMDREHTDLIIVGSQSATVSKNFNHIGSLAIRQNEFLIATKPDSILLCINPNDDIEYIQRTIYVLENLIPSKVLALVVYPFFYKNNWMAQLGGLQALDEEELYKVKDYYEKKIGLPCFSMKDMQAVAEIYRTVINFFSEE